MGTWGFGIFEGDIPLDMVHIVEEALEFEDIHPLEMLPKHRQRGLKKKINAGWGLLKKAIASQTGYDRRIFIQVLATLIIYTGAKFPQGFKRRAIASAFRDNLAKEDLQRRRVMDSMIEAILSYVGEPIEIGDDGTFDVDPDSVIYPSDAEGLFNLGGKG